MNRALPACHGPLAAVSAALHVALDVHLGAAARPRAGWEHPAAAAKHHVLGVSPVPVRGSAVHGSAASLLACAGLVAASCEKPPAAWARRQARGRACAMC